MASSVSSYSKKLWESLTLLPLQFKIFSFDVWEYLKVVFKYYRVPAFARADAQLVFKGLIENPFRVARFYAERGGISPSDLSSYTYGETPITTFAEIAKEAGLGKETKLIEFGAGRGRISLFASLILGCEVVAYEKVPEFVKRLKRLTARLKHFEVREKNYFKADVEKGNTLFLYGTTLSDQEIRRLGKLLEKAKAGTLLITVSWYLNETPGTPDFPVWKVLEGRFPWGKTNVYLQIKKNGLEK